MMKSIIYTHIHTTHIYTYTYTHIYVCVCHDEIYYFTHQLKKVTAEVSGQRIHGCHRPVGDADGQQDES